MSTDEIAIFPLSNVVLFPRMQCPLHLFEPRYRQLAEHVLADDRRIGMVVVPPEHADEMHGDPPVYPIGCAGTIGQSQKLRDGRFNIVGGCLGTNGVRPQMQARWGLRYAPTPGTLNRKASPIDAATLRISRGAT